MKRKDEEENKIKEGTFILNTLAMQSVDILLCSL